MSEAEMSQTLQVTYSLLNTILSGGNLYKQSSSDEPSSAGTTVAVDEPTLIHLSTVYGLLLPLVPLPQLQNNCKPLFDQRKSSIHGTTYLSLYGGVSTVFTVLSRAWESLDAAKLAIARINHCVVDIISGKVRSPQACLKNISY
jgi:hypothetical protein